MLFRIILLTSSLLLKTKLIHFVFPAFIVELCTFLSPRIYVYKLLVRLSLAFYFQFSKAEKSVYYMTSLSKYF